MNKWQAADERNAVAFHSKTTPCSIECRCWDCRTLHIHMHYIYAIDNRVERRKSIEIQQFVDQFTSANSNSEWNLGYFLFVLYVNRANSVLQKQHFFFLSSCLIEVKYDSLSPSRGKRQRELRTQRQHTAPLTGAVSAVWTKYTHRTRLCGTNKHVTSGKSN